MSHYEDFSTAPPKESGVNLLELPKENYPACYTQAKKATQEYSHIQAEAASLYIPLDLYIELKKLGVDVHIIEEISNFFKIAYGIPSETYTKESTLLDPTNQEEKLGQAYNLTHIVIDLLAQGNFTKREAFGGYEHAREIGLFTREAFTTDFAYRCTNLAMEPDFETELAKRYGLLFFDLNALKGLNDILGMATGDVMLKMFAEMLTSQDFKTRLKEIGVEILTVSTRSGDEFDLLIRSNSGLTEERNAQIFETALEYMVNQDVSKVLEAADPTLLQAKPAIVQLVANHPFVMSAAGAIVSLDRVLRNGKDNYKLLKGTSGINFWKKVLSIASSIAEIGCKHQKLPSKTRASKNNPLMQELLKSRLTRVAIVEYVDQLKLGQFEGDDDKFLEKAQKLIEQINDIDELSELFDQCQTINAKIFDRLVIINESCDGHFTRIVENIPNPRDCIELHTHTITFINSIQSLITKRAAKLRQRQ